MKRIKKLVLRKEFVLDLNNFEMNRLKGGINQPYYSITYCYLPTSYKESELSMRGCTTDCSTTWINYQCEGGNYRTNG